ncbi:hypothetical protein H5410_032555 [Solanum commersonii]|uniref:Uncharacterized protein n=1 Tax=Solanum commersonii TaxID=4109 RepID=A0A9J5YLD4_SOLCO|nr:hypothetical protein H5410_032555 [Solanum commersonii]
MSRILIKTVIDQNSGIINVVEISHIFMLQTLLRTACKSQLNVKSPDLDIRNVMAPGGRVYKQKTLTGQTVSSAQSADESNKCTRATATDDTASFKRGRGKTREKVLKNEEGFGEKMVIEIPGKGETVKGGSIKENSQMNWG